MPPIPSHHPSWRKWGLPLIAAVSYTLGVIGYWRYDSVHHGQSYLLDALYHGLQLFKLHMPSLEPPLNLPLELGRWLAATSTAIALGAAAHKLFWPDLQALRLRRSTNHVVVCGASGTVVTVVRRLRESQPSQPVVVVTPSDDAEAIDRCHAAGAAILTGHPSALLERAKLATAETLIVIGGDDALNVEIAATARRLSQARSWPVALQCHVQINDADLRDTLRQNRLLASTSACVVHTFDYFNDAAREVLLDRLPLDHDGIRADDTRQVHLAIVGFGSMGRTVAFKAAQLGHFANLRKLQISVVDQQAGAREQELLFRFPHFHSTCDITFYEYAAQSLATRQLLERWAADASTVFSVAVCLDDDAIGLDVAMRLRPALEDGRVRVALRMSRGDGLTSVLSDSNLARMSLQLFGWFDSDVLRPLDLSARDRLARMVHGRFLKVAKEQGRSPKFEEALQEWEDLKNDDLRLSNYQQADHIGIKLRAIGCERVDPSDSREAAEFTQAEIEVLAQVEHRRWLAERALAGWTWSPGSKDEHRRTSPHLVAWDQLSESTKDIDRDAIKSIPVVVRVAEHKKICRRDPRGHPTGTIS